MMIQQVRRIEALFFWFRRRLIFGPCSVPGGRIVGSPGASLLRCFLGSGPNRGQSPVEWREIPFVRPSIHPSYHSRLVRLSVILL